MHDMFKKSINILLAIVVLSATSGFSISKHYCHDQLVSIALIEAPVCGENDMEDCCGALRKGHCDDTNPANDNCCKNEKDFVKLDEKFTNQFDKESRYSHTPALLSQLLNFLTWPEESFLERFIYPSPSFTRNILVLVQCFRC